jgi:hypothetical protein
MSETQKLIAELAARFLVARIENGGPTNDSAYAVQCAMLAKTIVAEATRSN